MSGPYQLFAGDRYYPGGGVDDLQGTFPSLAAALEHVDAYRSEAIESYARAFGGRPSHEVGWEWWQVVDGDVAVVDSRDEQRLPLWRYAFAEFLRVCSLESRVGGGWVGVDHETGEVGVDIPGWITPADARRLATVLLAAADEAERG